MNLDLLKKLVRLANNNPNDNEANLAARKVCKLIEADNFNFNGNSSSNSIPYTKVKEGNDWEGFGRSYNKPKSESGGTWNDVKRSTEPEFKSTPPSQPSDHFKVWFEEFIKNTSKVSSNPFQVPFSYDYETKPPKQPKQKRPLKCSGCDKEVMTAFVGPEQVFLCYQCQWADYQGFPRK
ncbi:MAG TPA: hypothetical protein VNX68_15035 [Nitrosopumilaceae archaeon]|jgi:hypothetical protein|nr:hypothetical protein [Nitrosopumilaceae archaeon]